MRSQRVRDAFDNIAPSEQEKQDMLDAIIAEGSEQASADRSSPETKNRIRTGTRRHHVALRWVAVAASLIVVVGIGILAVGVLPDIGGQESASMQESTPYTSELSAVSANEQVSTGQTDAATSEVAASDPAETPILFFQDGEYRYDGEPAVASPDVGYYLGSGQLASDGADDRLITVDVFEDRGMETDQALCVYYTVDAAYYRYILE